MEENVAELRKYLPIFFENPENNKYVEYLTSAYLKNVESEKNQFAFIAFHILYMCFVYKIVWSLKKNGDKTSFDAIMNACRNKHRLPVYSSLFDISVLGETESFNFIRLFPFHQNDIDKFSHPVEVRNHCAHASGKLHYNEDEIEEYVSKELEYVNQIQQKAEPLLKKLFTEFLAENWNPEERAFANSESAVDTFIRQNFLSVKDMEYLTTIDIPELHKKSTNQKMIYTKVLYLVFVLQSQKYAEFESNIFLEKLPLLMNGFDEQKEITLESLVNDEFSVFIQDFSNEDKGKFENITKIKLDSYQQVL